MVKKLYKNDDYIIINSLEEFQEKRKQYKKFVLSPHMSLNNFEQNIIVDNLSLVYSRRFLAKNLTPECFNLLDTTLVDRMINIQYIKVHRERITKECLIKSIRIFNFKAKRAEEVLFVTENLYRDLVSEFLFEEKKERELFRNKLLNLISDVQLVNSILFNSYDKQRLLKIKGNKLDEIKNQKKLKFSIVCAMYNEENNVMNFLEMIEAIEYPREYFEVIIVNDGSTDESPSIEQQIKNTNINFRYINISHSGVSIARNHGLQYVRNKYVLFTDFDDVLSPNILLESDAFFKAYPKIDILCNPIYILKDENRKLHSLSRIKYNSRSRYSIYDLVEEPELYLSNVSGTVVSKKLISNIQFTPNLNFFEDTSWINQIIEKNKVQCYGFANDTYYNYNVTGISSLISSRYDNQFQIELVISEYIKLLSTANLISTRIACLKSINWFLSDAINDAQKSINTTTLQLMKKLAGLIGANDYYYLKSDRVSSVVRLLKGVNEYLYQSYKTEKFDIQYFLYSDIEQNLSDNSFVNPIYVFDALIGYEVKEYKLNEKNTKKTINSILLMDRIFSADDNAYYLYKYLKANTNLNIYFVLNQKSEDWKKLELEGFNLVSYASKQYKSLISSVDCIMSSHVDKYILNYGELRDQIYDQTFVFLQHGVINNDLKFWLFNKKIDYICSSFNFETDLISEYFESSQIIPSGMPRIDYLETNEKKYITYFTSWSKYLLELSDQEFINTSFFKRIVNILNANSLQQISQQCKLTIEVKVHPNIERKVSKCLNQFDLNISNCEYSDLISNSYITLTDFSSVIFDTLYTTDYVFFYNDNYEEYFCERKIRHVLNYDEFYIQRVTDIEEIDKYLDTSIKENNEKNNCLKLCRHLGVK